MYNKYTYLANLKRIRSLETELAVLKNKMGISTFTEEKETYNMPLYMHYVTVFKKEDLIKVKVNVSPCYKKLYTKDNYGWELIFYYTQVALFPLEFRYIYYLEE